MSASPMGVAASGPKSVSTRSRCSVGEVGAHVGRQLLADARDLADAVVLVGRQDVVEGADLVDHRVEGRALHGLAQGPGDRPRFAGAVGHQHHRRQVLPEHAVHLPAPVALAAFPGVDAAHAGQVVFELLRRREPAHLQQGKDHENQAHEDNGAREAGHETG